MFGEIDSKTKNSYLFRYTLYQTRNNSNCTPLHRGFAVLLLPRFICMFVLIYIYFIHPEVGIKSQTF